MCLQGLYARAAADADISIYASGLDYNRCHGGVLLVTVFRKFCMFMAALLRIFPLPEVMIASGKTDPTVCLALSSLSEAAVAPRNEVTS